MPSFLRAALVAAALALAARAAHAVPPPALVGTVTDSLGTPLPNAIIVVGVANRVLQSDTDGRFAVRGLAAGSYHLDVSLLGYAPTHLIVTIPAEGPDVRVDVVLHRSPLRLAGILVSATPTGTDALGATQATVALSGKGLALNLGSSVAQTLAAEPGMAMRYNGPMATMPVIRGLTGDRILVLQDGERTGDLAASSADHALSLDPFNADRIEVIRGPASLLYGNNALGGVVNVIANDIPSTVPSRPSGFLGGQGESVTPGGVLGGGLTVPIGSRLAVTARGTLRQTGTLRVGGGERQDNTDATSDGGSLGIGYVGDRVQAGVALRGTRFEFGVPFPDDGEAIRLDGRRSQAAWRATVNTGSSTFSALRFDGTVQRYRHDEVEPDGAVGTTFSLATETVNLSSLTRFGRLTGTIGAQGLLRRYEPRGDEAFTPAADSRNLGVLLFQELPLRRSPRADARDPKLQVGARYDWFTLASRDGGSRFGPARRRAYDNASASLGLSVPIGATAALSLNGQRAFRAPTVDEVFADGYHVAVGTYDVGNPSLRAEVSTGVEAVWRVQRRRGFAQLSAYRNRVDGYVAPRAVGTRTVDGADGPVSVPLVNFVQRPAVLRGVEAEGEWQARPHWVLGAGGDLVRGAFDDGAFLPYLPPARVGATVRWDNGRVSAGGGVRRALAQARVSGDALDVATPGYTLANVSFGWTILRGAQVQSLVLRADNLLDARYRDAASRIKSFALNPGRNLTLVYKILF